MNCRMLVPFSMNYEDDPVQLASILNLIFERKNQLEKYFNDILNYIEFRKQQ